MNNLFKNILWINYLKKFLQMNIFLILFRRENYIIIKKIEQFSRRKNSSINYFYEVFFNAYYNYFTKRILKPKNSKIKEGIMYINQLYDFINQLINIFKNVFHCSNQAQFKYKETFIKMINYKQVHNFEFILAIFTSEILYSQDSIKIFQEPF